MFKKGLLLLSGLLIAPILLSAYTSPGNPKGFVNDFTLMLKPETVSTLETTLSNFSNQTGNQISVVTVPTLGDESVETYAEKLFQEWGIGNAEKDTGLLLLIARDDREIRIEVGYGLEPVITDIESSRIIREVITPAFKQGDYDGGVLSAVSRIITDIDPEYPQDISNSKKDVFNIPWNLTQFIFFLVIIFGSVLGRSKSWWMGGILGAVAAIVIGLINWSASIGVLGAIILVPFGLLIDFLASKSHQKHKGGGGSGPWFWGGGFGGRGGGGFGGFGGGMSGGGGASGRW